MPKGKLRTNKDSMFLYRVEPNKGSVDLRRAVLNKEPVTLNGEDVITITSTVYGLFQLMNLSLVISGTSYVHMSLLDVDGNVIYSERVSKSYWSSYLHEPLEMSFILDI